jgi:TetR/AcrR family transcriptional repressor of bet genes
MPKKVDHDMRREDLAKAAFRVIAKNGLAAATLREVAREAHCSAGSLVHYLKSKDALLLEAAAYSIIVIRGRMIDIEEKYKGLDALRRVVMAGLPTDENTAGHWKIWFGFWEMSEQSPEVKKMLNERYAEAQRRYSNLIKGAQEAGDIPDDLNVPVLAASLTAMSDGIGVQAIRSGIHMSAAKQRETINLWIDGMLRPKVRPASPRK